MLSYSLINRCFEYKTLGQCVFFSFLNRNVAYLLSKKIFYCEDFYLSFMFHFALQ